MTDSKPFSESDLLNYLDQLPIPPGKGWLLRPSTTGRGWRLLTTSLETSHQTAREAIIAAMTGEHDEALSKLFPGAELPGHGRVAVDDHAITANEIRHLASRGLGSESNRAAIVDALREIREMPNNPGLETTTPTLGRKLHIRALLAAYPMSTAEELWELLPQISRDYNGTPNAYTLESVREDLDWLCARGDAAVDDSGRYWTL